MLNPRRSSKVFIFVGLTFGVVTTTTLADEPSHGTAPKAGQAAPDKKPRPIGEAALKPYLKEFISERFWIPEKLVETKYASTFPTAMKDAVNNNKEDGIADITVELMATLNEKQIGLPFKDGEPAPSGSLREKVDTLLKEEEKEREASDEKIAFKPFLERLKWAMEEIGGQKNENPDATEFKAKFAEKFKAKVKDNDETKELVDKALNGNDATKAEAVGKLRAKVNREGFAGFIAGQKKSGNADADKLAKAMGWEDKDAKKTFFDFANGDAQERVYAKGTEPADASAAIAAYYDAKKKESPIHRQFQNAEPEKAAFFFEEGGKLQSGVPAGVKDPKAVAKKSVANEKSLDQGLAQASNPTAKQPDGGPSVGEKAQVAALTSQTCLPCHNNPEAKIVGSSLADLKVIGAKEGRSPQKILAALGMMPELAKNKPFVEALKAWAAAK